jgi:HlyD family secretion protein
MKRVIEIFIFLALLGIIGFLSFLYYKEKNRDNGKMKISGNIEATEVRLSFRMPGKIKEMLSDEGLVVQQGDVLARLETDELIKIKNEAQAGLTAAELVSQQAAADYQRYEKLYQAGAIAAQKRDNAKTYAASTKANVDALKASCELIDTRLGFADLVSSFNGFILTKSAQVGEVVAAGAVIFTITDLKNVWFTGYINETNLGKIRLNQPVMVSVDSYPDRVYQGRISFIANEAEFTPKQIQTQEERVKLVYRIKVMLDNYNLELKPGMPADAVIQEK